MEHTILGATETFMRGAKQEMGVWAGGDIADTRALRVRMLAEEFAEYVVAEAESDLVEVVDGLLDIIVISWGTLLSYVGPELANACAQEVADSNIAKVVGPGLPIFREDGKVMKPEGWQPPNIRKILKSVAAANVMDDDYVPPCCRPGGRCNPADNE